MVKGDGPFQGVGVIDRHLGIVDNLRPGVVLDNGGAAQGAAGRVEKGKEKGSAGGNGVHLKGVPGAHIRVQQTQVHKTGVQGFAKGYPGRLRFAEPLGHRGVVGGRRDRRQRGRGRRLGRYLLRRVARIDRDIGGRVLRRQGLVDRRRGRSLVVLRQQQVGHDPAHGQNGD